MKRKSIPLSHINVRERPGRCDDISCLAASIENLGLTVPLLVNPADFTLIAGERRYWACKKLGKNLVRVAMPSDVAEACEELGTHVTEPDLQYGVRMTPREKLDLCLRLSALPRPVDREGEKFYPSMHPARVTGFSPRVLNQLKSTLSKAAEEDPSPTPETLTARQILALMLESTERPIEGYSVSQTVTALRCSLLSGDNIPCSLKDLDMSGFLKRREAKKSAIPTQNAATAPQAPFRRSHMNEFRRGFDAISGALTGLEMLMYAYSPQGDDAEQARVELKKSMKSIRKLINSIPGGGNGQENE